MVPPKTHQPLPSWAQNILKHLSVPPKTLDPTSMTLANGIRLIVQPETITKTRAVMESGASSLLDELRLSLDFYGAQEAAVPVERVVLCGPGSAIPGLAARMEPVLGLPIAIGRCVCLEQARR